MYFQIVRMLVAIVVIFVVCWTPLLSINILQSLKLVRLRTQPWAKHLKTVASLLAYLNSALNPIVYGFMSRSFRDRFRKSIFCWRRCRRSNDRGITPTRMTRKTTMTATTRFIRIDDENMTTSKKRCT